MNANEIVLWLAVALLAFVIGHARITRQPLAVADQNYGYGGLSIGEQHIVRIYRTHTLERLVNLYNMEELRTLSFDIGLVHEEIPGDTLSQYARELIAYCERRGMLRELLTEMR